MKLASKEIPNNNNNNSNNNNKIIIMKQKKMQKYLQLRKDTYLQKKENKLLKN